MTLTIKYGLQKAYRDFNTMPTVGQLKADETLRMELGYGDNVNVLIDDVVQPDFVPVPMGTSEVEIETAANKKAG